MTRVLVVLPTSSYRTADFVHAARALDMDLAIASEEDPPYDLGDRFVRIDLSDAESSAHRIVDLADHSPIDAVVAVDDAGVEIAARASEELGLPHHPPAAAAATRDKLLMRQSLGRGEVSQPRFVPVGPDPFADAASIGYPVVIKPRTGAASRGVLRVDRPDQLAEAITTVGRIAAELGEHPPLLMEEFLGGAEVAVEGLVVGGDLVTLAVFDKPDTPTGPTFEETILVTPSKLAPAVLADLDRLVDSAVRTLGLTHGPVHAEARIGDDGKMRLLEVAARSIGGLCGRALRFGLAGSSLEQLILATAVGRPAPTTRTTTATGILMLPIPREGMLESVDGVAAALELEGVTDIQITVPPGTGVRALPYADRYLGFVFASGPDPDLVVERLRAAWSTLDITIT